jgi:hypothetical protein
MLATIQFIIFCLPVYLTLLQNQARLVNQAYFNMLCRPTFRKKYVALPPSVPVTVAERSKACTVFARSEAGIVNSNPTEGMNV